MEYPTRNQGFMLEKRETFGKSTSPTSFPELLHANFSMIVGTIFGP